MSNFIYRHRKAFGWGLLAFVVTIIVGILQAGGTFSEIILAASVFGTTVTGVNVFFDDKSPWITIVAGIVLGAIIGFALFESNSTPGSTLSVMIGTALLGGIVGFVVGLIKTLVYGYRKKIRK